MNIIDAHIHFDQYSEEERAKIIADGKAYLKGIISVSMNLDSAKENLSLAKEHSFIFPAFGFHPEQDLPTEDDVKKLMAWIRLHQCEMIAVGEVGLPFYLRKDGKVDRKAYDRYITLLDQFIKLANDLDKPIILHAVYDDTPIVCDLLEKYHYTAAHFHWFKGDCATTKRMADNGYYISVTPDVLYEEKIQEIVIKYPLHQLMVETDGPWPFEGPFQGKLTHPIMIHESVKKIAELKKLPITEIYEMIYANTVRFYRLKTLL